MDPDIFELLAQAIGFDWDAGNTMKVVTRHDVEPGECEQAFLSEPFLVRFDALHSKTDPRWQALGRTSADRWLFLAFTIRSTFIRVRAARDMNRKERLRYGKIKESSAKDSDL